jgi:hypothetical protein
MVLSIQIAEPAIIFFLFINSKHRPLSEQMHHLSLNSRYMNL